MVDLASTPSSARFTSSGEVTEPSAISTPSARSQAGARAVGEHAHVAWPASGSRSQQPQEVRAEKSGPAGDEAA